MDVFLLKYKRLWFSFFFLFFFCCLFFVVCFCFRPICCYSRLRYLICKIKRFKQFLCPPQSCCVLNIFFSVCVRAHAHVCVFVCVCVCVCMYMCVCVAFVFRFKKNKKRRMNFRQVQRFKVAKKEPNSESYEVTCWKLLNSNVLLFVDDLWQRDMWTAKDHGPLIAYAECCCTKTWMQVVECYICQVCMCVCVWKGAGWERKIHQSLIKPGMLVRFNA